MDIARLRTLKELAHYGTMVATANALGLTASAVSQQISALEAELGLSLTQRHGRGVRLTPAGEVLVRHAQQLFMTLDEAHADMARLKQDIVGKLRVATFASVAVTLMPTVSAQLAAQYPQLHVLLEEMEPNAGLAALGSWRSDLVLIDDLSISTTAKHEHYGFAHLMDDRLMALVPAGHVLANQTSCSLADLREEPWALDIASSGFSIFVHKLCAHDGFAPRLNASVSSFEVILAMVAAGCSVSVAPRLWLAHPMRGVNAIALQNKAGRKISAVYRRGERHHPAIKVFLEATQKASARLLADFA